MTCRKIEKQGDMNESFKKSKAEDALLSLNNKLIQEKLAVYESRLERLSWQEGFATVD